MQQPSSLLPPALRWTGPLLAACYGLGARLHRAWTTPRAAPLPTICIGNITVGGTGKTPAAKYFARGLAQRGRKPAVLQRGYKGQAGDEAVEIQSALSALNIPVLIGADRLASARRAKEQGRDVVLLDDGFQHWRLARDLDIVLLDATDPFGGNQLVPWGRLREYPTALSRAGVIIITRADSVAAGELAVIEKNAARYAPHAVLARACHRPVRLRSLHDGQERRLEELRGARISTVCGIGNPDAFHQTLQQLGAELGTRLLYPDHHTYTALDFRELHAATTVSMVVTTAKDAAKLSRLTGADLTALFSLEIEFTFLRGEDAVWAKVDEALASGSKRVANSQQPIANSQ